MKAVSVFMITYNHERFVGEAIQSIVSQKTNFDFELVIGEDKSSDNTRAVCEQYASKYPDIIKLLPSDRNYGPMGNTIRVLEACTGKYVAMCEGDDYWTDTNKLQKQVDFLESHPDFTMCFSRVDIIDELEYKWPDEKFFPNPGKDVFTIEDFILSEMNIMPTPTVLFKNVLPRPFPDFFHKAGAGDTLIQLFIAEQGKTKCFDEKMAAYRNHAGGNTKRQVVIETAEASLKMVYENTNRYFNYKYDKFFRRRFLQMAKVNLIYGSREKKGVSKFRHYRRQFSNYLKYSEKLNFREIFYYHAILFFPWLLKLYKKH